VIGETEVLVRVRAASANPLDWFAFNGTPYVARPGFGLKKPDSARLGADLAGVVEAVGRQVTGFQPGDEVFGAGTGSFAELATVGKTGALSAKPASLTFEQAAAVPVAGLTALQGLRDKGGIQPGQQVLINGASGGVGTFAVQIAKTFDTQVTAVCSTGNVEAVRALGADRVVDYTREDFTRDSGRYDLMLDVAGSRPWSETKRALRPDATVVIVGGPKTNPWLGPLGHIIGMSLASLPTRQKTTFFISKADSDDLATLTDLIDSGKVTPVVEQTYPLSRVAEAMGYLGTGHARGKLVITI
jgi:NADPH:quinone reductase-like Zn-dependent oxidoreductase